MTVTGEPRLHQPDAPDASEATLRAVVVVPARDEAARVGACIRALAGQEGLAPGSWEVVLVLDGCTDDTGEVARAAAGDLRLHVVDGPGRGVGFARRKGMEAAARRLRATAPGGRGRPSDDADGDARSTDGPTPTALPSPVIASTDADSVVAPDWLARILAAVGAGAGAVGGAIALDAAEAAGLPAAVLAAREEGAARRLAAVRVHAPAAEHHQFSGASLALTLEAYERVGGLPEVAALEDEALERALRAAGVPISYRAGVCVTTSARTASTVPHGLAQVLRTARWRATAHAAPPPPSAGAVARVLVVRPPDGRRGDAIHRALRVADPAVAFVVVLGPGIADAAGAELVARLEAAPALQLVRAAEGEPDPLAELVVRPMLNLHAPELAVVASPLTRTWAIRRPLLDALPLPHGDVVDLTVLLDTWRRHGLDAIGEHGVVAPAPGARADPPLAAYALLAALATRTASPTPALSSAFADPSGVRRASLDEHTPLAG